MSMVFIEKEGATAGYGKGNSHYGLASQGVIRGKSKFERAYHKDKYLFFKIN